MTDIIQQNFPFPIFRTHQRETIQRIIQAFKQGKKFVVVEAPTGSGKSPIALTVSRIAKESYILTPQKILQDQYMKDFGNEIVDLKGRNAYNCTQTGDSCTMGICIQMGKSSLPECVPKDIASEIKCPYYQRIREAQISHITLFNFKSFLYQTPLDRFPKRKLIVIDECHNTEKELVDVLAVKISENQLRQLKVSLPVSDTISGCLKHFRTENLITKLRTKIKKLKDEEQYVKSEKLRILLMDVLFIDSQANDENFVVDYEEYTNPLDNKTTKSILFRPIYVKNWSHKLFDYGNKILLMSATVLNYKLMIENLGININDAAFIRIPSIFPVKNRPIVIKPVGFMTYKHIDNTLPKLVHSISETLSKYQGKKGIIHTHSFKILNYIKKNINSNNRSRLLFQNDFDTREQMLLHHSTTTDSVLVAPAMHEGVDLKDDLSRFQIICKVPYPNSVNDVWMKRRTKESWHFYTWLTALKLVQCYGRSVRSENDKAVTIVLDSQFEKFLKQCKYALPVWFNEAIVRR